MIDWVAVRQHIMGEHMVEQNCSPRGQEAKENEEGDRGNPTVPFMGTPTMT